VPCKGKSLAFRARLIHELFRGRFPPGLSSSPPGKGPSDAGYRGPTFAPKDRISSSPRNFWKHSRGLSPFRCPPGFCEALKFSAPFINLLQEGLPNTFSHSAMEARG